MTAKLSTDEFIKRAKSVHGNLFDYSRSVYINSATKVTIICPIHGEFQQLPISHINKKSGCPKCAPNKKMTLEEVIEKSKIIHNNKYSYSNISDYKNGESFLKITCPIHGEFEQKAKAHLAGYGCSLCANNIKYTTEYFIQKAQEVHKNKGINYDYSKTIYKGRHHKLIITCPIHGDFTQIAKQHLNGAGCSSCAKNKKMTLEEFKQRANVVHNNFYDYSKTTYVNSSTKTIITCPIHGDFYQEPHVHISGCGCKLCGKEKVKLTKDEFIARSTEIHKGKYLYDNVVYINSYSKVKITCPIHGDFEQMPNLHLLGSGCKQCVNDSFKLTQEEFLSRCKAKHGNRFIYDKTQYIDYYTPVIITCRQHGDFLQKPSLHLEGAGCQVCKSSRGERAISKILDKHNLTFSPA